MREKLLSLMKNEGLKPSQLAEMLGINPAGISHILAGRNKPGFDLLQKILRRFPQISPDWLLLDEGPMYRSEDAGSAQLRETPTTNTELFDVPIVPSAVDSHTEPRHISASAARVRQEYSQSEISLPAKSNSTKVTRVVILYDDQTFESYTPTVR